MARPDPLKLTHPFNISNFRSLPQIIKSVSGIYLSKNVLFRHVGMSLLSRYSCHGRLTFPKFKYIQDDYGQKKLRFSVIDYSSILIYYTIWWLVKQKIHLSEKYHPWFIKHYLLKYTPEINKSCLSQVEGLFKLLKHYVGRYSCVL